MQLGRAFPPQRIRLHDRGHGIDRAVEDGAASAIGATRAVGGRRAGAVNPQVGLGDLRARQQRPDGPQSASGSKRLLIPMAAHAPFHGLGESSKSHAIPL